MIGNMDQNPYEAPSEANDLAEPEYEPLHLGKLAIVAVLAFSFLILYCVVPFGL